MRLRCDKNFEFANEILILNRFQYSTAQHSLLKGREKQERKVDSYKVAK